MNDFEERVERLRAQIDDVHCAFVASIEAEDLYRAEACLRIIGRMSMTLTHADVPRGLIGFAHLKHVEMGMAFASISAANAIMNDQPVSTPKIHRGH